MRTLVLGLGNEILSDDGVGILAARRVRELVGDDVHVAEACVATIDLLSLMSGYDRVVIIDSFLSPTWHRARRCESFRMIFRKVLDTAPSTA